MNHPHRRTVVGAALVLLAGANAADADTSPKSRRSRRTDASFDRELLDDARAREARSADAWERAAAHRGWDASSRRRLAEAAAEKRTLEARCTPAASDVAPPHGPPLGPADLGRHQATLAERHRRTLARLRTAQARAAFAPVLAAATYHAGLLRTLQARGAAAG